VPKPFPKPPGEAVEIVKHGGPTIAAFAVDHDPAESAVDYKDRSVVISGDTSTSANLEKLFAYVPSGSATVEIEELF
jgi:ribonuclease BN (tRNA processing enzyme)